MSEPTRAAVYARVSTDEQARDGTSLQTQLERCRAFVAARGWTAAGEYVDEGVSGTRSSRPALDRMMEGCRAGEIGAVVFAKFDRFSRNRRHLENATAELDDLGVSIVSVTENVDGSTATGQAFRALLGVFANLERDMIVERTTSGLRATAKAGFWPGGPAPYGFTIVADGSHSKLIINEDEAAMLRLAVERLVDHGDSTLDAARALNSAGYRPRRSRRWTSSGIRRTLSDASLEGEWLWGRQRRKARKTDPVVVHIPPIITKERAAALRARLGMTSTVRRRDSPYLLNRGRIIGPCGNTYFGVFAASSNRRKYRCYGSLHDNARSHKIAERCECRRVDAELLDEHVWTEVCDLLGRSDVLHQLANQFRGSSAEDMASSSDADEALVRTLERSLERAYRQRFEASNDDSTLISVIRSYEAELLEARQRLAATTAAKNSTPSIEGLLADADALVSFAQQQLPYFAAEDRARIIDLLQIEVRVEGWHQCRQCYGTGRIPGSTPKLGGHSCPGCLGLRKNVAVLITGAVFDSLLTSLQDGKDRAGDVLTFEISPRGPSDEPAFVTPAKHAPRQKWTVEQRRQMNHLLAEGLSDRAIAAALGRSEQSVFNRRHRLRNDVPVLDRSRRLWTLEEHDRLIELRRQELTHREIAIDLGRTIGSVKQYVRRRHLEGFDGE